MFKIGVLGMSRWCHYSNFTLGRKKCSNKKLRTSTLVNDATTAINCFASALSNVHDVKTSNLNIYLIPNVFLTIMFFPLCVFTWKWFAAETCTPRNLQDFEKIHGADYCLTTLKNFWQNFLSIFICNFSKSYLNNYFAMKFL